MNITIKEATAPKTTHVTFNNLAVGEMVEDQHGWCRLKVTHDKYLCMQDAVLQVHHKTSWPAYLPSGPVRTVKITIEDV